MNKQEKADYMRKWHAAHREERNAQARDRLAQRTPEQKKEKKRYLQSWHARNKDKVKAYRDQTKDRRNTRRRERYAQDENHRNALKAQSSTWYRDHPGKKKNQRLLYHHQISLTEFQALLISQQGACAICGHSDLSDKNFFPVVDHCHTSKKVRGLLCMNCNMGLGKFKDNPLFLQAALTYLAKTNGSSGVA